MHHAGAFVALIDPETAMAEFFAVSRQHTALCAALDAVQRNVFQREKTDALRLLDQIIAIYRGEA